jgi:hypothetical protein
MQAFDRYQDGALTLQRSIEDLQREALTVGEAERKLFAIFHRRLLPARLLVPIADAYFTGASSTSWAMLNACTAATKTLPPGPNLRATVRLGRFFGLGRNGHGPAPPETAVGCPGADVGCGRRCMRCTCAV